MTRYPELDALRGIAAIGVVLFHWFPQHVFWFWSFVDLFFVISGFLISRIVLVALSHGRFSLKNFWYRRILRIWPVYYLTLLAVCLAGGVAHGGGFYTPAVLQDIARSVFFLQFTEVYFDPAKDWQAAFSFVPGFLHSWSLAVEEQFYLVWPLVLLLVVPRFGLKPLVAIGLLALLCSYQARLLAWPPLLTLTRLDGVMLGAMLAVLHQSRWWSMPARRLNAGFVLALLIGAVLVAEYVYAGFTATVDLNTIKAQPRLILGFAIFYTGCVGLLIRNTGVACLGLLRTRVLLWLGSLSYAIYMFHLPILRYLEPRIADMVGAQHGWLVLCITAALVIGLPQLSYRYIEHPLQQLKHRYPNEKGSG